MTNNDKVSPMDENRIPFPGINDLFTAKTEPTAFDGGTGNARGDESGSGNPLTLFTVTGEVLVGVYGVGIDADLASAGGATLGVGTASNSGGIIPATTATTIDVSDVWVDTTPSVDLISIDELTFYIVTNGENIVETTLNSQDITAGNIFYVALYRPITSGSTLVAV